MEGFVGVGDIEAGVGVGTGVAVGVGVLVGAKVDAVVTVASGLGLSGAVDGETQADKVRKKVHNSIKTRDFLSFIFHTLP